MKVDRFTEATERLGLKLSKAEILTFEAFEDALYEANEVMNLTRVPRDECWIRHFLDSLLFQDLIPNGASVLDIGTGPGFPAWPLACARPDLTVCALDSNGKMLGFLQTQPLPNLEVVNSRAEDWRHPEQFDFVTGRAVAPISAQLEISAAFCKIGGLVVPMRTPADESAVGEVNTRPLGLRLRQVSHRPLPGTDIIRMFPVYVKESATALGFPRRWAELKKKPL